MKSLIASPSGELGGSKGWHHSRIASNTGLLLHRNRSRALEPETELEPELELELEVEVEPESRSRKAEAGNWNRKQNWSR